MQKLFKDNGITSSYYMDMIQSIQVLPPFPARLGVSFHFIIRITAQRGRGNLQIIKNVLLRFSH